jgi:hypothetical protein
MNKKRNIKKEKSVLKNLVLLTSIWILAGVTIFLYMLLLLYSKIQPELNVYFYGIFAGITGAIWGAEISEVAHFWNWARYGNNFYNRFDWAKETKEEEWYSPESFNKNLLIWKKRCIYSLVFLAIIGFIIGFFRFY